MSRLNIAIVGCGPAGLATALLLHRDGHTVMLFERFAEPRPLGSGLMLQPSGMAVLEKMGLAQETAAHCSRIDTLFGLAENGRVALNAPYAKLAKCDAFGLGIHRASLFRVLYQQVQAADIAIRTGHEVRSSMFRKGKRHLIFADGSRSDEFDLVVDASGWASRMECCEMDRCGESALLPFGALWCTIPVEPSDPHAKNLLEQRYLRASQMVGVLPIGSRGPE